MSSVNLLKKLYGDPMVSRCCKSKVFVQHASEGGACYTCKKCAKPCDALIEVPDHNEENRDGVL